MEPILIADYNCVTGEGPLWHPGEKRVYWTDIHTGRMFRYSPRTGKHEQFYKGEKVGGYRGCTILCVNENPVEFENLNRRDTQCQKRTGTSVRTA
jgi:sugar lactone lactonase YvrE